MIAGEQGVRAAQRVSHVVGRVARRCNRFDRPTFAGHDLAICERVIRLEFHISAGIETLRLADMQRPCGAMWPFRKNDGAGCGLHRWHRW